MNDLRSSALAVAVKEIPGDVVEIGVADGRSIRILRGIFPEAKKVYGYDTFNGMPAKMLLEGEEHLLSVGASVEKATPDELRAEGIIPVVGVFPDTIIENPENFPEEICYAHLDADNYKTTLIGLDRVWPRLAMDGLIAIHDFRNRTTPGVALAVKEFMEITLGAAIGYGADYVVVRRFV